MAVPKKKTSISKSKKRRGNNYKIRAKVAVQRKFSFNLSHHIDLHDGIYNKKLILKKKIIKTNSSLYTTIKALQKPNV